MVVSAEGHKMDPTDTLTLCVLAEKPPNTIQELCKLLGFIIYYRSYIQDFSRTAQPLYDLIVSLESDSTLSKVAWKKKKAKGQGKAFGQISSEQPLLWTQRHQNVLKQLPPKTAYPDLRNPFSFM